MKDKRLTELRLAYQRMGYSIDYIRSANHSYVVGVVAVKGVKRVLLGWYSEHAVVAAC